MKWFKHYSNARQSNSLTELIALTGLEGYGRYWVLLELMSEKFDGLQDDKFVFSTRDLMVMLGYYHFNPMRMYLQCVANVCSMSIECTKNVTTIQSPILLELHGRDFKKARSERGQGVPKSKKKSKDLDIDKEEEVNPEQRALVLGNKYFKRIPPNSQELILESYPLDFIQKQLISGIEWIERSAPRYMNNEASYLISHFSRQWEYQNKKKKHEVVDIEQILKEQNAN